MKNVVIAILSLLLTATIIWLAIEIRNPEYKIKTKVDTTKIVERDTVFTDTTIRRYNLTVPPPIEEDSSEDSNFIERTYKTSISDSLIDGTVTTVVKGFMVDQQFSYRPTFRPLRVTTNVNTTVTKDITKTVAPKPFPSVGLDIGMNNQGLKELEPSIWWTTKRHNSYGLGYKFTPEGNYPTIGIRYNLRNLFK